MKKVIFTKFILVVCTVLVLTAVPFFFAYHETVARQSEESIRQLAKAIADGYTFCNSTDYLDEASEGDIRVTLISKSGEVLYETDDVKVKENHIDRPEVQAAIKNGIGSSRRLSNSLGYDTYYCAVRLQDGRILRTAIKTDERRLLYNTALKIVLPASMLALVLAAILSKLLTKRLVNTIEEIGETLDDIDTRKLYPELQPFAVQVKKKQDLNKELEQLRQDFTANVSHELKTPLTSISGYAEMIETGIAKQEDIQNFASKIHVEASRLLNLIGDIIQLSELEVLSDKSEFEAVDLLDVAQRTEEYLSLSAVKYGVHIETKGKKTLVQGNRNQIEELVYNLCDNAIRYNRTDGSVIIDVGVIAGEATITVKDTGIGIPKENIDRVFERFYRVDKGRSKKTGGTGLGLAIVKHIAIRHNARITLDSELNIGTTISVAFANNTTRS